MSKTKKIIGILLVSVICALTFSIGAAAKTISSDGLKISISADKSKYDSDESISVSLKVVNDGSVSAKDVTIKLDVPDGYTASGKISKSTSELKVGDKLTLKTKFKAEGSSEVGDEEAEDIDDTDDDEDIDFTDDDEDISDDDESDDTDTTVPAGSNGEQSDDENNDVSGDSSGSSQEQETTDDAENNPITGVAGFAPTVVILLAAVFVVVVILDSKKGRKGGKFLSLFLCLALLTAYLPAIPAEAASSSVTVDVKTTVKVNGKKLTLTGSVTYTLAEKSGGTTTTTTSGGTNSNPVTPVIPNPPVNPTYYTVTYYMNDGTDAVYKTESVASGSALSFYGTPSREVYIFGGWYKDSACTISFPEGSVVTSDLSLYADWLAYDEDGAAVAYVAANTRIEFADGDCDNHVTKSVKLAVNVGDLNGVSVVWSSSDSASVSNSGNVTRPNGSDKTVTMTAVISKGNASVTKSFVVRVIHNRDRLPSEVTALTEDDIYDMNDDVVIYHDDDNYPIVEYIMGKFVDFDIRNADDALDAVQSVKDMLGITDAYSELALYSTMYHEGDGYYTFIQKYNGVELHHRTVTVCANENYKASALRSGLCPTAIVAASYAAPAITAAQAESIARSDCGITDGTTASKLMLYATAGYTDAPLMTYCVKVNDELTNSYTVYVNAQNGNVVYSTDGIMYSSYQNVSNASADGEFGDPNDPNDDLSFPVVLENNEYYMRAQKTDSYFNTIYEIEMINNENNKRESISSNTYGSDPIAVSAYTNILTSLDYYYNVLRYRSFDNIGSKLFVFIHSPEKENNACWRRYTEKTNGERPSYIIQAGDTTGKFKDNGVKYSQTADVEVLGHELTHGVSHLLGVNGGGGYGNNYLGAIDEAYSDIFGCLIKRYYYTYIDPAPSKVNWIYSENIFDGTHKKSGVPILAIRNPEWPESDETYTSMASKINGTNYEDPYTTNDPNSAAYKNSGILSHAAYLMSTYGLSDDAIAKVWHKSRFGGCSSKDDFFTVRRNVIHAARELGYSDGDVKIIKKVFDEVGLIDSQLFFGELEGIDGKVSGAPVEIWKFESNDNKYKLFTTVYSDENGKFEVYSLPIGKYNAVIKAESYVKVEIPFEVKIGNEIIGRINSIVLEPTLKAVINMPGGITDDIRISIKHEGAEYARFVKKTDDGFIAPLPAGTYAVSLNANGYVYSESISVSNEVQTRIEINFKPSVMLYVYDAETNEPITDAVITGASLSAGLSTNSEGRYGLSLGVGRHELYINADGYSEYSIIFIITEADLLTPFERQIGLSKEKAVDITITVLDENGDPFEIPDGMTVTVENNSGEYWEKNISSDKTAAFSLLKGNYTASVNFTGVVGNKNDGFGNATWTGQTTFSVPLDNNTQPVIKVAESVETAPLKTFIVQEAGGIPVSGALLLITSASTDTIALTTDSDGKASITLPPDKFIVSVHKKAGANKWSCGGGFVTVIVTESVNEYIITADKEEYIPGNIADISAGYRTAAVLMKDGTAYTWGNNSWGSAGVGNNDDSSIPSATRILLNHITAVFKGNDNCGAAISGNKLYVWGIGSSGQLGLGTPEELGDRWKQYGAVYREIEPTLNPYISTASKAGIGKKFMIILSDGKVYGCGDNNGGIVNGVPGGAIYSPVLIEGLNSIVDISVGDYFSMALTADGDVYTWGSTSQNVLGREWSSEGALTPEKVEIGEKVIDISAGYNRAAVVTESGKLFSWGSGTGKLPTEITVDGGKKVIDVELGESVSACITEDNCLYTWGNKTGAGHGDKDSCSAPTLLLENIAKVALGENFGLALTYDGKLYIWGSDNWSQQCNGEGNQHDNPTPVELILTP